MGMGSLFRDNAFNAKYIDSFIHKHQNMEFIKVYFGSIK